MDKIEKIKLATVWLAGCSGCHMSFLDLDEWLFELVKYADVVHSPIADIK
jgi:NAD-reducing hydrogenase small subunit